VSGSAGACGAFLSPPVPLLRSTARERELTAALRQAMAAYPVTCAVLVRRHGVYIWGESWQQAKTQAECYHYLFAAAVQARALGVRFDAPPADVPRPAFSNGAPRSIPPRPVADDAAAASRLAEPDDPSRSALAAWLMSADEAAHVASPSETHACQVAASARVSAAQLAELGVLSWHLPPGTASSAARLAALRAVRGFSYDDTITVSRESMGDAFDQKMAMFFAEHIHSDEEVRYITAGGCYFDVRRQSDGRWLRVHTRAGDLILLPAGLYHRLAMDPGASVTANRLFVGEPVWRAINRGAEADTHPARAAYLAWLASAGAGREA